MMYKHGYNKVKEEKKKRRMEMYFPPETKPVMQPVQHVRFETLRSVNYLPSTNRSLDEFTKDAAARYLFEKAKDHIEYNVVVDEITGGMKLVSELVVGVKE